LDVVYELSVIIDLTYVANRMEAKH